MESTKQQLTLKQWVILIICILGGISSIYVVNEVLYLKSKIVCGTFFEEWKIRGTEYKSYQYILNDKEYKGNCATYYLKEKKIDNLKQYNCIEIEYSIWFPSHSRVVDKKILR